MKLEFPSAVPEIPVADIVSAPEPKPWKLHEFTAADLDGNLFRVFYDFAWEEATQVRE